MKFVLFYHSFVSCWNHGNAHFLRGMARELVRLGHEVKVYEPEDGWSRTNALQDAGHAALEKAADLVPGVEVDAYRGDRLDLDAALEHADVVIVHEWNTPELVAAIGRCRLEGGGFLSLFHDTHHRAVTAPNAIDAFDLDGYDAVLAFGEVLRQLYLDRGWGRRAFTWHEAADTALFRPLPDVAADTDLIWIGNWGDGEREIELEQFLIEPIALLGIRARVHGVRYPASARADLAAHGIAYEGWLPNHQVPEAFARARATIHIPRRPYVERLPGIPTIRVFEALACGIPLVCAPWSDTEELFPRGSYLTAADATEMTAALSRVLRDGELAADLAQTGLATIRARHTCAHRVAELLQILHQLGKPAAPTMSLSRESERAPLS
jgi:spore maturation protein CgeB